MKKLLVSAALLGLIASAPAIANTCTARQANSTDQTVYVTFLDATTGVPNSSLAFNSSGIDLEYVRTGATAVDITEATQTTNGAHSDGGFVSVGHGRYRLDLPDAAVASGVPEVVIQGIITGYILAPCSIALSPPVTVAAVNSGAIDNADFATAPGAAGGLQIAGSNAATTYATLTVSGATTLTGNVSMAAGLNITQSSSNTPALVVTGNGTGNGATITSGSGATGSGLSVVSAATNGSAVTLAGVGTGNGLTATGGATGHGISGVGGATSGNGIRATGTAGNSAAMNLVGQGSAAGLLSTGGATGHGASLVGGATSGSGLSAAAATSGAGIVATGVGTTQAGIAATGGATSSAGISAAGGGTGSGLLVTGGATGHGISAVGGATSGNGIRAAGTAGNSDAMNLVGQGSAAGLLTTGGATGHGISAVGGATSGSGLRAVASTSGNGIIATGVGTTQAGIAATGGSTSSAGMSLAGGGTGAGLLATGGATGHGMSLVGGATSGNGIATSFTAPSSGAPELGFSVSGTLSGTHSSTTADLGANAPTTISDLPSMTLYFPSLHLSRSLSAYDTSTGVATFAAIDADITLANGNNWILYGTAPGSAGGGPTAAEIADAVLDEDMTAHQTQGTLGQAIGDPAADTDTIWALANSNLNATVSSRASQTSLDTLDDILDTEFPAFVADVGSNGSGLTALPWNSAWDAEVESEVDDSIGGGTGTALTAVPWNASWDAEVQSEANDALVANYLDQLLLNTYNPASPPGAVDSFLEDLVENDAGVTRFNSNSLEQAPTSGGGNMTQIEGVDATDAIDARVAASLATYDPPTRAELTTDTNSVLTAVADVPTNAELATALGTADDATLAAIAALPASIGDIVIEDQGSGISLKCSLSVILAAVMGDVATSGGNSTYEDPSGTETRATTVIASAGNRTATITCPTY